MFIGFYEPEVAKATNFSLNPSFRRSVNGPSSGVQEDFGQLFVHRSRLMPGASFAGVRRGPR